MKLALRTVLVAAAFAAASAVSNCPDMCIDVYDPVCGSDGVTYGNSCMLSIATCESNGKITEASKGECAAAAPYASASNATGSLGQDEPTMLPPSSSYSDSADDETTVTQTNCDDIMCTMDYTPVCGSNNITYGNSCMLGRAQCKDSSITKAGDGHC